MRYLMALLLLAALIYGGWPYFEYHRLDQALASGDRNALERLVDLEEVRASSARCTEKRLARQVPGQGTIPSMVREGARWMGQATGDALTLDALRDRLRRVEGSPSEPYPSLSGRTTFAFFESPTRFLARIGELDESPLHLRLRMRDWQWRLVAVYPCE
jgi:hypothetical protein